MPQAIDHREQAGRQLPGEPRAAVAQLDQHALRRVGQLLQPPQPEEAGGSLDGVKRAEDDRDVAGRRGVGLQREELAVELIEAFATFDHELLEGLVVHARRVVVQPPFRPSPPPELPRP